MSTYAVLLEPTHLLSPVYGLAMLALLVAAARGAGTVLARCAPLLLGPTPADRLAAAEERAERLAVRNQLARELHDSVGHALSAVTLQAGAARKVLETDHTFVRDALTAIEEVTRDAVAELDTVLGALHEGAHDTTPPSRPATSAAGPPSATAGQRLTTGLESLVRRTRSAGLDVTCAPSEDLLPDDLPADVAHTAYRIVQEGLSNALRHAAAQPLRLWLASTHEELRITMENPFGTREDAAAGRRAGPPAGGGRGLHGIAERAALLGGVAEAGEEGGMWRLTARLPLSTADAADTRQKRDR